MTTRPFLSIAVPTYERPQFLDELLQSIHEEVVSDPTFEPSLEVLVSDNGSGPATAEVVKRWQDRLPIRYTRHDRNLGGPRNLVGALGAAAGEYVLFIGDDDRLRLGAHAVIREMVEAYRRPPVCVFAPSWYLGEEFMKVPKGFDAALRLPQALRGYLACAGIPAGCVIRTDLVRLAIERAGVDRILRTNWPQTAIAFIAAGLSGENTPVIARHGEIAHISEHHDDNVLYEAWTVWHTGVHGKLVAAQVISEVLGDPELLYPACEDIFTYRRMNAFAQKATWHILGVDSEENIRGFADKLEASLEGIPEDFHEVPQKLIELARMSPSARKPVLVWRAMFSNFGDVVKKPKRLVQRFNDIRRLLRHGRRYRRKYQQKLARYKSGADTHVRYYAHEGY